MPVSLALPALLGRRESVMSITLTHLGCCSVSGIWDIPKKAKERKVLLLEWPTSVAEPVGMGGRGGWTGRFPAAQIIPHKQSLGPSLPFLLWTLLKCGGWRSHHAVFHLCSAALSYQKQEFKGPRNKIPCRPLTRLPRALHNLFELISWLGINHRQRWLLEFFNLERHRSRLI